MAVTQAQRQTQLFYGEDWKVIYTAFTQVNFASYDFDTIQSAMMNYIRLNYPEDFNDWSESSEFIAIIELLAYLGQSLAFRMDLNTRENFMDTATRRESILRLARMVSYNAPRAMPSQGLMKINSVLSSQDIYDSLGNDLNNVTISWNDPNNQNWLEQFILVINSSLTSSNYFGNPSKSGTVNGIDTELYEMNTTSTGSSVFPFTATIAGNSMNFEFVNPDFNNANTSSLSTSTTGTFIERAPNPANSWFLIYRSDGLGNSSPNTGFFLMFKQGTQGFTDYQLDYAIANRVIDVNVNGINNIDVWVQNIDTLGNVQQTWTPVPSVNGFNVIYNSLSNSVRNIYSVYTRDNAGQDQISLRFADGNFGNVPLGIVRVWYRVSNGLTYQIRPTDLQNIDFALNYADNLNNTFGIVFNSSLQNTVANSQARPTNQQIKLAASQNYYTQDRMTTGEDYNLYPLTNPQALKVNAVNRVYSGQNRFLDINDPTGSYQDTKILSTDGIIWLENDQNRVVVNVTSTQNNNALVTNYIQPMLNGTQGQTRSSQEAQDFYYYNYPQANLVVSTNAVWQTTTVSTQSGTGAFYIGNIAQPVGGNVSISNSMHNITPGALLNIANSWIQVTSVTDDGTGLNNTGVLSSGAGAITLSYPLPPNTQGYVAQTVISAWNPVFTTTEIANISAALSLVSTFGLRYDYQNTSWEVITHANINTSAWSLQYAGDTSNTNRDSSWMMLCSYTGSGWQFNTRATRYVYESVNDVRFLFTSLYKTIDIQTGKVQQDTITVLDINSVPNGTQALGTDYVWKIVGQDVYPDGFSDPTSVYITPQTSSLGAPVDPNQYNKIVAPQNTAPFMLFWTYINNSDGYQYWTPATIALNRIYTLANQLPPASDPYWVAGEVAYVIGSNRFFQWSSTGPNNQPQLIDVTSSWMMRIGRNNIRWIYDHFAPDDQPIDPAIMNIIDIYVLTSDYDINLRNWVAINGAPGIQPQEPTVEELRETFQNLEGYKTMTDQIVWHPVSYKLIFGSQAPSELQVRFKVVKTAGTTTTDNEIRSGVISAVNSYFALANWDFGQSFFFTELAAYIHIQLATLVATVVITPVNAQAQFGDLFEITCNADELFLSCARVSDVDIVTALTDTTLGI